MKDWRDPVFKIGSALRDYLSGSDSTGDDEADAAEFLRLIEEGEYYRIHASDLPAEQYGVIKQIRGISTLVFDPENIPRDVLLEARGVFNQAYEDNNGFALEGRGSISAAIKQRDGNGLFEEIYDYFEYKIPRRYLPVLEDAITLRIIEDKERISSGEIYDWRGEIADNHRKRISDPQETQNLISLCSAGYFDEGRFFTNLYEEMVERGPWTSARYESVFTKYVKNNPFVVFVQSGTDPGDVYAIAKRKADRINQFEGSPGFIDVCGKGDDPQRIVEKTIDEFRNEHPEIKYERIRQPERDQYILRVLVDSL